MLQNLAWAGVLCTLFATTQACQVRTLLNAHFDQEPQGTDPIRNLPGEPEGDLLDYYGPDGGIRVDQHALRFDNWEHRPAYNPGSSRVDLKARSISPDRHRKLYYCWTGRSDMRTPDSEFTIKLFVDLYGQQPAGDITTVRFTRGGEIALSASERTNDYTTVSRLVVSEMVLFIATVDLELNRYRLQIISGSSYDSGERPFVPPSDGRPWFPGIQLFYSRGTRNQNEMSKYWVYTALITQNESEAQNMVSQYRSQVISLRK